MYKKDYVIENFVNDRVQYFKRVLDRTKCINFTKEQKKYLCDIYKVTLHPFYFEDLKKELQESQKTTMRIELVLVDK